MASLGLVGYGSDDSEEDEDTGPAVGVPSLLPPVLGAGNDDDDDDDDDEEGAKPAAAPEWSAPEPVGTSVLPDFEDALAQAETPAFLTSEADRKAEFEHVAFDSRPTPPEEKPEPSAPEPSMPPPKAPPPKTGKAAANAAAAARDRARGVERKGEDKESVKDRTKLKRQRDQSASFLGGRWKSDEEMHMRDNFDS